jgi:hypothetical protein
MLAGMKTLIALLCALPIAAAAADDEDKAFRHILTLVQTFTSIAAQSASPERDIADVLAGRNESGADRGDGDRFDPGAQGSDRDGIEVPRLERVPRRGEAQ